MPAFLSTLHVRRVVCIVAAAYAVALAANYVQPDPMQSGTVVEPALSLAPAFGPGGSGDLGALDPLNGSGAKVPAVIAIAPFATEEKELIVNVGLRQAFDFFLLKASGGTRENASTALRTFLTERLSAVSAEKALQIAVDYRTYINQHDALLAAQNFDHRDLTLSTLDVGRIRTWMQLRQRLRQNTLGEAVAEAWYQNDEAQLNHVLDDMTQVGDAGALDDANRRHMQAVVDKATTRFADIAHGPF